MAGHVTVLEPGTTLDASPYFAGPWREFSRIRLAAAERLHIVADGFESAVFVMSGAGSYLFAGQSHPVAAGSALTIGHGSSVEFVGADDGLELFSASLNVTVPAPRRTGS